MPIAHTWSHILSFISESSLEISLKYSRHVVFKNSKALDKMCWNIKDEPIYHYRIYEKKSIKLFSNL